MFVRLGPEVVIIQVCGSRGGCWLHRDGPECQHHQQDPEVVQRGKENDFWGCVCRVVQRRHLSLARLRYHQKQQTGQRARIIY